MSHPIEPRRPSFLRDVLVQFTGTVLAAAFLYLWAVGLGYVKQPERLAVVLVIVIGVTVLVGAVVAFLLTRRTRRSLEQHGWANFFISIINGLIVTAVIYGFAWLGLLITRFITYAAFRT